MSDLTELSNRWGIETSYVDVQGNRQQADPDTIRRIAGALASSGEPAAWPTEATDPQPAFQGAGRGWVLAVQLYSIRSRRNWGHGDFTDLARLLEVAADVGAAGVGLNPLHALFTDRPEDASPYAPSSRVFLNPLYIDVTAIPEFSGQTPGEIGRLRGTDMVDYAASARLKLTALRQAYGNFCEQPQSGRKEDFESFCQERGRTLELFAAFETLRRRFNRVWWEWSEEWRKPDDRTFARLRESDGDELLFHQFLQWIADRQLKACRDTAKRRGMPVGLYIDLAVGVDAGGADAWIEQGSMLNGLSVGAPPDALQPAGQDWGLTTYNPHGLITRQFEPLREMLRGAMRYAGAIRLDHVLGLMRLYVIPRNGSARAGAYLRFPFTQMLAVIAEESRQHCCIVIGEDLGTVPENFRETLSAWGVWSYLVMVFEREWDGSFRPPERYLEKALATFATHDLPTYAGWMSGHDLAVKRAIGFDPGETDEDRERSRSALRAATAPNDPHGAGFEKVVEFLAATRSRLVAIAIEDVLGVEDQINVPGTLTEHPNWRRRLPVELEDLGGDQRLLRIAAVFARAGRSSTASA